MVLSLVRLPALSRRMIASCIAMMFATAVFWLAGGGPLSGGASNGVTVKGHYIPIDPPGKLYVTDNTQTTDGVTTAGNTVSVFDEKTNDLIATIPVGHGPKGIDVHFQKDCADTTNPTPYFYVANSLDNTLSVVKDNTDVSRDVVAWTNTTGRSPWGVAVDHCGPTVAVANNLDSTLSLFDGDENQVLGTVGLGAGAAPRGVAADSSNHRAYTANSGNGTVSVVDLNRRRLVTNIAVPGSPVSVAGDGHGHMFVVSTNGTGSGTLSVINEATNTVAPATTGTGPSPFWVAVNAVNGQVDVTNNGNNTLSQYSYNGTTFSNVGTINLPPDPRGVTFTTDGRSAYIAEQSSGTITEVNGGAKTAGDRNPPSSTINNNGPYHPGGTLTGTSTDDAAGVGSVAVGFTAAGSSTPPSSTANASLSCSSSQALSCAWSAPLPAGDGNYKAWVRGTDRNSDSAGANVELWKTLDGIVVDGTAPTSAITGPPSGSLLVPGVSSITGSATDNVAGVAGVVVIYTPQVLGSPTTASAALTCNPSPPSCTWTSTVPALAPGAYQVQSQATDLAGNVETPGPGTIFNVGAGG